MRRTVFFQLLAGAVFFAFLTVLGYLLFVLTGPGQEYDYVGYTGRGDVHPGAVHVAKVLMKAVTIPSLYAAGFILLAIGLFRRRFLLGLMAIIGIFFSLAGTELMKNHLPRPSLISPAAPISGFLVNESYPSGHTAFATSIALGFVLVSSARWRPWVSSVAGLVAALYGITVIFVGAHRPADPIGGIFWSAACMALAAALAVRLRLHPRLPDPHFPALALGSAFCLLIVVALLFCSKGLPPTFHPLLVMLALIITAAFASTAWFGRALSAEIDPPKLSSPPATQ
ncbi:hypothetical protein BH09VER1_BH09VER1_48100 [soil metagenome]